MLLLSPRKRNTTAAVDCTPTVSIGSLNNNNSGSSQQQTSKKSNTYNNKMRRSKSAPPSSAPSFAQDIRPQSPVSEKKNDYMRGYALRKAIFFNKWKSEYFVAKKYKLCWYKSEKSYMKNKKPRGSFVYKNSIAEMVVAVNHNTTNNSNTTSTGSGDSGGNSGDSLSSPRINVNNQFQFISGSGKMILLQCESCEEAYKWVTVLRKMIDSGNSGRKLTLEPCEPLAVPDADLTSTSSSSSSMSSSISTSFKRIRRGTTSLGKITMNTLTHTLTELTTATTTAAASEDTASSSTCSSATVDCISPAVSPRTMEVMEQQEESSSSSCSSINPNNNAIMVKNTTEVIVIPSIVMPSGPDSARSPPPASSESNATTPLQPITIVVSSAADAQVVPPDNSSSSTTTTTTTTPRVDHQFGIAINMSEKDKEDLSYLSRILSSSPSSSTTTTDDAIPSPFSSSNHEKKNKKNKKEKKIDSAAAAVDEYRGDEMEMDHLSTDTQRNKNRSTSLCNAITMTNHHYSFAGREQVQQLGLSIPPRTNHSLNQMIMNQQQQEQQQQQQEQKKQPSKKKKKRFL